jgi:phage tail sheath protein FI
VPITPTYPGVYIEEIPSGVRTITGVATSITAFVGYTARGPLNEAVRVQSFADFDRKFGGLHRDSEVGYAVQQFFMNGGTDSYVVRVATGAAKAGVTLRHANGASLLVTAVNEGAWANLIHIDVDYATTNPDSTFNLTVTRNEQQNGALVPIETEQHRNLSMNRKSGNYVVNVVNSASRLIRVERPANPFTANDRGFSRSGDLSTFPNVTSEETTVSGMLDGATQFTLKMSAPPTNIGDLVTKLTAAIATAGLTARLGVERVDALGATSTSGNHVQLNSKEVTGNDNTSPEFSSVQVTSASLKLKLGLANGGREKEGASFRRPLQTGTSSADLADRMGKNAPAPIKIKVLDRPEVSGAVILAETQLDDLSAVKIGPELPAALQKALRNIPNSPATAQATVQLNGTFLRVVPSAETPNAAITFTAGGTGQQGLRTLPTEGGVENVQRYSLGTGATTSAQSNAALGSDGLPPGGAALIGDEDDKSGIYALLDVDLFNMLAIPRTAGLAEAEAKAVIQTAIAFCVERRAFYLVDPDPTGTLTDIDNWVTDIGASKNAAVFFPRIRVADPLDDFRPRDMPASGAIAGVYARTDGERGVWKAPAGIDATLRGTQGLSYVLTDGENGTLNPLGINCLRTFPVYGTVVWGARTLEGADQRASEWKYVPVRRLALMIEESLYRGTQWVVFEPNDEPLWAQIRLNVGAFMQNLFRQGAFQGTSAREAYFVKCDKETTIQNDIDRGIVNILVGFAPLKPAEFVMIKIQQMAGQIQT